MKFTSGFSLALLAMSTSAFATSVELDAGATEMTSLLLRKELQSCVTDWQKDDTSVLSVTKDQVNKNLTVYKIQGLILLGGDAVVGEVELEITKTRSEGNPMVEPYLYACKVTRNLN